jgi:hypothetical protein
MLFKIAALLLTIWVIGILMGKGRFLHILLLCGIALIVVETAAIWRAKQG